MLDELTRCEKSLAQCRAALGDAEARYRTLFEHAPEAIVVLDADAGHFVDANSNAVQLFELPRELLLDSNPVALSPPTQPGGLGSTELAWERIQEALAGGAPAFEWLHRTPGGKELDCEVRLVRLPAAGRRLVRGSITELSRQRRLEQQLSQWQRLETLGQLAGGVAHDLNSVLQAISTSAETLAHESSGDLQLEAEWIRQAVAGGSRLTRGLLGFLRGESSGLERVDLSAMALETAALLRRLLPGGIRLLTGLQPDAWVECDRGELEQVLLNLVLNARDAMPTGTGTISVSTRQYGRAIRLRVEDDGVGMNEATRQRMFEAFFSTKPPGKGTGLGLAVVQANVSRAAGRLEVGSEPGKGTVVDVYLPAAPPAEADA